MLSEQRSRRIGRADAVRPAALVAAVLVALAAPSHAGVLNARAPAPSPDGSEIAFSYMGDLWKVPSAGGRAERLTVHEAYDTDPVWSPDGTSIAFTSDRHGNDDVYVMPAGGGEPVRLTCHSTWDNVECWSRDGEEILFLSDRDNVVEELFVVPADGGAPRRLVRDSAYNVSLSPDGRWIAFVRGHTPWWRKHYRGSASRDIWLRRVEGGPSTKIVGFEGDDDRPMWGGDGRTLYFTSERDDAVSNVWRVVLDLPLEGDGSPVVVDGPSQVTRHDHDGVQFARISEDGGFIVYEWDGGVWMLTVPNGESRAVEIDAPSDVRWNAGLRRRLSSDVTDFALSPDEDEVAVVMRGEVYVCPLDDGDVGDAMRITETAAREKDVAWGPDGRRLYFASDRSGDYDIYAVTSGDSEEEMLSKALRRAVERLTESEDDEFRPMPSPDGGTVAYLAGEEYLRAMDADGGNDRLLVPEAEILHASWSPDGQWIALSRTTMGHKEDVFILPSGGGDAVNVTDHMNDDFQPLWSEDGRRLSFASRTDEGEYFLKYMWLRRDDYWKSDEEREEEADEAEPAPEGEDDEGDAVPEVAIDFEGLSERVETVVRMRGGYDFYAQTPDGHHYAFRSASLGRDELWLVDWKGTRLHQVSEGGSDPEKLVWDKGGRTCYYLDGGAISTLTIDPETGEPAGLGRLGVSALFTVDIAEERAQMFNEAWRLLWNGFYDDEFHGVDWPAMREKYEPLALAAYTDEEFRMVVREMIGELSASHLGIYRWDGAGVSTGRLGIRHDEGHEGPGVRVESVIPDGPADRAGIEPGEHILAVGGTEIAPGANYHCLLADTVDRELLLRVAETAGGKNARDVRLRPEGSWAMRGLVYDEWVRANEERVESLSGGRIGYVHIPGMGNRNLDRFAEDLFAQGRGRDALIIDIRGNGGGSVHDMILRYLDRRTYGYETTRDRPPSLNPLELWAKPLALVIDETCYSDAEIFPMGWKALGLGPVVGTPTFGAVIGTNDVELIDGTMFRVPGSGWYDLEGRNLENWGIEPDIRIDAMPEDAARGIDRQLEKSVEVLLADLERG